MFMFHLNTQVKKREGDTITFARKLSTVVATAAVLLVLPSMTVAQSFQDISGQLNDQNRKAAESHQHINDIDGQINRVQAQINDTQAKISETNAAVEAAKRKMAIDQAKLNEMVRREYQRNRESELELLAGSNSISEYVQRDTYLKASQNEVADLVAEVAIARKQLEAKSAELATLGEQLQTQQNGLNFARAQEANQLAAIEAARADLKRKLARFGGQVVFAGDYVNTGDLIGFEGTSGCSTGSHLHFEVQQGGQPVNPKRFIPGRFRWPQDGFQVNQEFGPPNWAAPYSYHTGIDISQHFGAPIYAAASGRVIFAGYNRTGFGDHVIIDHGGGLVTIYGHMGARASDYPSC